MAQYTDLTILMDRSASMSSIRQAMESAINELLIAHRAVPSSRITLGQFDDAMQGFGRLRQPETPACLDIVYEDWPIAEAPRVTLSPRGNTPLWDAVCTLIDRTGARLEKMAPEARPDQVLFIIITDGQENASRTFRVRDVAQRITRQRDEYQWQFVFLGANQDAFGVAKSMGIDLENTVNYSATAASVGAMAMAVSESSMNYVARRARSVGASLSPTLRSSMLSKEEQHKAAVPDKK